MALKVLTSAMARSYRGKAFQCSGTATWKDLLPRVTLVLPEDVANSIPSADRR